MAIDDLLDEHEQSERVRSWLRNNGAGLLGGVALATLVVAVVYRLVKARLVRRSAVMRGALQGR